VLTTLMLTALVLATALVLGTLVLAVRPALLTALLLAHAGLALRLALLHVFVQLNRLAHLFVVLAPAARLVGLRLLLALFVEVLVGHRILLVATPARRRP
jgi:hypothetical protein